MAGRHLYVDLVSGNDSTGTGAKDKPFLTTLKASQVWVPGDDIRIGKGPANTALSGTFAFVNGSKTVNTSVSQVGVLHAKEFLAKTAAGGPGDVAEFPYEVASVNAAAITLLKPYLGATETVAAKKLGTVDFNCAEQTTICNTLGAFGRPAYPLVITGGWNLSTETQDGETWIRNSNAARNGYGFYLVQKPYVQLKKLGFLRHYTGIWSVDSPNGVFDHVSAISWQSYGLRLTRAWYGTFTNVAACCGTGPVPKIPDGGRGVYCSEPLPGAAFTNIAAQGNRVGIYVEPFGGTMTGINCDYCACGLWLGNASNCTIRTLSARYCTGRALRMATQGAMVGNNLIYGFDATGSAMEADVLPPNDRNIPAVTFIRKDGVAGKHVSYWRNTVVERDPTAYYGEGGASLKITPQFNTITRVLVGQAKVAAGEAKTLTVQIKQSADFAGKVFLVGYFEGLAVVANVLMAPGADWTECSLTFPGSVTTGKLAAGEYGVLKLYGKVQGSAGSAWFDGFAVG